MARPSHRAKSAPASHPTGARLLRGLLATDSDYAGIGTGLLKHALAGTVAGASLIGGRALVVHALDEKAADFWRRRGFLPSKDGPAHPLPLTAGHRGIAS